MSDRDDLFEHDFDGIREYDNPLPGWWKWLFGLSIAFSVVYFWIGHYRTRTERYEAAVVSRLEAQFASLGELTGDTPGIVKLITNNREDLENVRGMFQSNCAQCHGNQGEGNIGPNLTDEQWKNVKTPGDIYEVIRDGVPSTSMPAWGPRLRDPQLVLLAAYVATLRGSEPAGAKAPEGERIPPWPSLEEVAPEADGAATAADEQVSATGGGAPGS